MKRRKEVGRLDIENPKCKWHETVYLQDGKLMKTIHDGSFSIEEDTHVLGCLYFEAAESNSTVKLISSIDIAPNIEYSLDGESWFVYEYSTSDYYTFDTITLRSVGDRVYFRGQNNAMAEDIDKFSIFQFTGKVNCGGSPMSLLDKTLKKTNVPDYGFYCLFGNPLTVSQSLLTPPDLSGIVSIGYGGCIGMLSGQQSLTKAADMPDLVSIADQGCYSMYANDKMLVNAANMKSLTSIGLNGCGAMYVGCDNLVLEKDGRLTFDFISLPFTESGDEQKTFTTVEQVVAWMQEIK